VETAGRSVRDGAGGRRRDGAIQRHRGQRDAPGGRTTGRQTDATAIGPGAVQDRPHRTAAVQPVGHVRPVHGQLRGGVLAAGQPERLRRTGAARHADRRAVRPGHCGQGRGRGGRARGQVPGRPDDRAAGAPRGLVRPGAGAAHRRGAGRWAAARRPAVLRRRGHAVDGRAAGPRPAEHGPRQVRVLPDRVQRIRPGGRVRPRHVAQPLSRQPGLRLLAAVRFRHRGRVQVRPDGRRRLQHDHPGLGQRGRGPVREVRPGPSRGHIPGRRSGPGARLSSGRVRPQAARAQGRDVHQHPLRNIRQRGPVRQHHIQQQGQTVQVRRRTNKQDDEIRDDPSRQTMTTTTTTEIGQYRRPLITVSLSVSGRNTTIRVVIRIIINTNNRQLSVISIRSRKLGLFFSTYKTYRDKYTPNIFVYDIIITYYYYD